MSLDLTTQENKWKNDEMLTDYDATVEEDSKDDLFAYDWNILWKSFMVLLNYTEELKVYEVRDAEKVQPLIVKIKVKNDVTNAFWQQIRNMFARFGLNYIIETTRSKNEFYLHLY